MTKKIPPAAPKTASAQPVRPVGAETQPGAGSPPAPGSANTDTSAGATNAAGELQPGDARTGTTDRPGAGELAPGVSDQYTSEREPGDAQTGTTEDAQRAEDERLINLISELRVRDDFTVNRDVEAPNFHIAKAVTAHPEITAVISARDYGTHWVLVVQSAKRVWKVEVTNE